MRVEASRNRHRRYPPLKRGPTLAQHLKTPLLRMAGSEPVSTVLATAQALDVHHVTLFEGRKLLGVVCTCDLEELPGDATVGNAVKRPAVMLDISASLAAALERMSSEVVGSVLVTRSGDPVGLVTREDLVRALPT